MARLRSATCLRYLAERTSARQTRKRPSRPSFASRPANPALDRRSRQMRSGTRMVSPERHIARRRSASVNTRARETSRSSFGQPERVRGRLHPRRPVAGVSAVVSGARLQTLEPGQHARTVGSERPSPTLSGRPAAHVVRVFGPDASGGCGTGVQAHGPVRPGALGSSLESQGDELHADEDPARMLRIAPGVCEHERPGLSVLRADLRPGLHLVRPCIGVLVIETLCRHSWTFRFRRDVATDAIACPGAVPVSSSGTGCSSGYPSSR